jgi:hypothetical protein
MDRGSEVMWYPPTGRRVSFEAEFVDRFSGGLLVEHGGQTPKGSYVNWGTTERAEPPELLRMYRRSW